jgi:ArsR family transcriptional regulator
VVTLDQKDLDAYLSIYMVDRTFKALSDPTRRRILALLRPGDLSAGDIASHFPIAFASVSHHLQVLRDAGLVLSTRQGQQVIYSLNTTVLQEALQYLLDIGGVGPQESPDA